MALQAGTMSVTLEYAKDLPDKDVFGKQDPYAVLQVGGQKVRSRTHEDGGKNPVWNETFNFQCINENDLLIKLYDCDVMSRDDPIGEARVYFAKAREQGQDHQHAAVVTRNGRQKGFVAVRLVWNANSALRPQYGYPQQPYPSPYPAAAPGYSPYPAPAYGGYPAPGTAAPGYAPAPYAAPAPYPAAAAPYTGAAPYPGAAPAPYPAAAPAPYPGAPAAYPGAPPYSQAPPAQYGQPPPYGAPQPAPYGAPQPAPYGAPPAGQYPPAQGAYPGYRSAPA